MTSKANILALTNHLAISPTTIQQHALDMLGESIGGELDIVDPTSPYIGLLEMSSTQTSASMCRFDAGLRKLYPKLALNISDLTPHLSDDDVTDLFATPVRNHYVYLSFGLEQIKQYAIADDDGVLSHVYLPKDTTLKANGISFIFHQPIVITVYGTGEVKAKFDDTVSAPLSSRLGNVIDTRIARYEVTDFLEMAIPCDQLNVVSYSEPIISSSSWSMEVEFSDKFHYAQAYYTSDNITWYEMHTAMINDVYDSINPTMLIDVTDGILTARIPDIFVNEGKVGVTARVDIYTTQGELTISLGSLDATEWDITWNDFGGLHTGLLDPLQYITSRLIYSTQVSNGGDNGLAFTALRNSVIYGKGNKSAAYTEEELTVELANLGYGTSLRKDNLTDRIFTASKSADNATLLSATDLSTGIGVINQALTIYTGRTDLNKALIKSEKRSCLLPTALYKSFDGSVSILSDSEYSELHSLDADAFVAAMNENGYYYSPFHTVLDYSSAVFQVRSYWLTNSYEQYRNRVIENGNLVYTVETNTVTLEYTEDKYVLSVTATKPSTLIGLYLQLTVKDDRGNLFYLSSDETVIDSTTSSFNFVLETSFDFDTGHDFDLLMKNSQDVLDTIRVNIAQSFNLVYVTTSADVTSTFDTLYSNDIYTNKVSGITLEETNLVFGKYMDGLSVGARTLLQSETYETYKNDVPDVYAVDIYEKDATGRVYTLDDQGVPVFNRLHIAGEQKLDEEGELKYLHRAGDYVLDIATGEPTVLTPRDYSREVRIPLFDARFNYITDTAVVAYRESLPSYIFSYLENDILSLRETLFARTNLFFEPQSTMQYTTVKISEDAQDYINTALSFTLVFQLTATAYEDDFFRDTIIEKTKNLIVSELETGVFSYSNLIGQLNNLRGSGVLNVSCNNPIGSHGYAEITDPLSAFSIDKSMKLESNGLFSISDRISFSFEK